MPPHKDIAASMILIEKGSVVGLLAVTNDNIRLPIIIQNRRNKHTFDTYAYTNAIFPLVLEKTCFVGDTFEYKWKTKQKAQFEKRNAEMHKRNE